jgi:hypothetical protein
VLVPVSAHGSAKDRNCASASTMRLTMPNRSKVLPASRSTRVTIHHIAGAVEGAEHLQKLDFCTSGVGYGDDEIEKDFLRAA